MEQSNNEVLDQSFRFSLRIIKLSTLLNDKRHYILARQILKSGTSIGANIEESIGGQSKKDLLSKMSIAYKEARETKYWLRLLRESAIVSEKGIDDLLKDIESILAILGKIKVATTENLTQ